LSGTIPSSLVNLPSIGYLDLSYNKLTTPLPPFLQKQPPFQIYLNGDTFCCPIYQWIIDNGVGNCTNCQTSVIH